MFLKILETLFKVITGLRSVAKALLPFLRTGTTVACFRKEENFLVTN
jgi:hypothetical protein